MREAISGLRSALFVLALLWIGASAVRALSPFDGGFADGFETGSFSRWTTSTGIAVQATEKFSGSYGALASLNKGTTAEFASRTLPGTYTDLYYDVRFKLLSGKSSNTNILGSVAPRVATSSACTTAGTRRSATGTTSRTPRR